MNRLSFLTVPFLIVAVLLTGFGTPAMAQSTDADIQRAKVFQVYLKAQNAVGDLLQAEQAFSQARANGTVDQVADAAGDMMSSSTEATYWSVVLDERVKAESTDPEAAKLSGELRALTSTAYTNIVEIVSTADYDELEKRLDGSAEWFNGMNVTVRKIYELVASKQ